MSRRSRRTGPARSGPTAAGPALALALALGLTSACGEGGGGRVDVVDTTSTTSPRLPEAVMGGSVVAQEPEPGGPGSGRLLHDPCVWVDGSLLEALGGTGHPERAEGADDVTCTWEGGVELVVVPTASGEVALGYLRTWQSGVRPIEAVDDLGRGAVVARVPDGRTSAAVAGEHVVVVLTGHAPAAVVLDSTRAVWAAAAP